MQNPNTSENDTTPAMAELLAFALYAVESEGSDDQVRDSWQASSDLRIQYRTRASALSVRLKDSGWKFRQGDHKQLTKSLTWLLTVPPRTAYNLQEERDSPCLPPNS